MAGQLNPTQFEQGHLFPKQSIPLKQPHQMSRMEFSQRPDVLWHASHSSDLNSLRESYDIEVADRMDNFDDYDEASQLETQGFHAGTLGSAVDRAGQRRMSGSAWLHPLHLRPDTESVMRNTPADVVQHRASAYPASRIGWDQGDNWEMEDHYSYYRNEFEDIDSVSAIVGSPHDVKTHADYVEEAMRTPGRIPSGAARWETQNRGRLGTGLKVGDVEVAKDPSVPSKYAGRSDGEHSHLALKGYRDPLESAATRVFGRDDEGEQQTLFNEDQYRRR